MTKEEKFFVPTLQSKSKQKLFVLCIFFSDDTFVV